MKKITLTAIALLCALCCAFSFVACGGDGGQSDMVSCELAKTPDHVYNVQILDGDTTITTLGTSVDRWTTPKEIKKDKEYNICLYLDTFYEIGSLKMTIDGEEVSLSATEYAYTGTYTPTGDFKIEISGEAKLETASFTLKKMDVKPFYDFYSGQSNAQQLGEQRKAKICDNFYVKLLVNGVATAPLKKMRLTEFVFADDEFDAVFNKMDSVEFVLYTEDADLTLSSEVALYVDYAHGADVEYTLSTDKKSLSVKIEETINPVAITIKADFFEVANTGWQPKSNTFLGANRDLYCVIALV